MDLCSLIPTTWDVEFSTRGCIIASPSYAISGSSNDTIVTQDYVYNWTRDSAVAAMELAAANIPFRPGQGVQPLIDYVNFANICQQNAVNTTGFPDQEANPVHTRLARRLTPSKANRVRNQMDACLD